MLRDEVQQVRNEIGDCQIELDGLAMDWMEGRIDHAEYGQRSAVPKVHLDALRAERRRLHDRQVESARAGGRGVCPLTDDDNEALVADLIECRDEAIKHKKMVRKPPWTGQFEQRQRALQALADEIDWYSLRLETLGKLGTVEDSMMERAGCRYCHHRIARLVDKDAVWLHCDVTGMPLQYWGGRGCRAAAFDRDGDWNDAFPRTRRATPERGSVTRLVPRFLGRRVLGQGWREGGPQNC